MLRDGVPVLNRKPLLFARLVPADGPEPAPAGGAATRRVVENPGLHSIVACSSVAGQSYAGASEVGTVCNLSPGPDGGVLVIPSLETKLSEGKYTLHLCCTEEIVVE